MAKKKPQSLLGKLKEKLSSGLAMAKQLLDLMELLRKLKALCKKAKDKVMALLKK